MYISGYIEKVKRKAGTHDCSDTRVGKRKSWTPILCSFLCICSRKLFDLIELQKRNHTI